MNSTSPIHHSSPKLEPITPPHNNTNIIPAANGDTTPCSAAVTVKSESTLPAIPHHIKLNKTSSASQHHQHSTNTQLQQASALQSQSLPVTAAAVTTPTEPSLPPAPAHLPPAAAPGIPLAYPMMPQLMPVQIVQTSSGPMQVQPFIHNGQFGITQVTPCRQTQPGTAAAPAVIQPPPPRPPPLGMTWGPPHPQFYPAAAAAAAAYNMGCRMPAPPAAAAMYCHAPPDFYMMRPAFAMPAGAMQGAIPGAIPAGQPQMSATAQPAAGVVPAQHVPSAADSATATPSAPSAAPAGMIPVPPLQIAPPARLNITSMPVCQQLRIQQQHQQQQHQQQQIQQQQTQVIASASAAGSEEIKPISATTSSVSKSSSSATTTSEGIAKSSTGASHSSHATNIDTLQQACNLSNIKQSFNTKISTAATTPTAIQQLSAAHLKSPDSGFDENHTETTTPSNSESEVSLIPASR